MSRIALAHPNRRMGSQWQTQKQDFQNRMNQLTSTVTDAWIDQKIAAMNAAMKNFLNRGGVSNANNGADNDYATIQATHNELLTKLTEMQNLSKEISTKVSGSLDATNLKSKYATMSEKKDSLQQLRKEVEHEKNIAEASESRQKNLEKPRSEVSFYQGFTRSVFYPKPLRVTSLPFLIGGGLILIFLSFLLLREFFQPTSVNTPENSYGMMNSVAAAGSFFQGPYFLRFMAGFLFATMFVVALAWFGVFGKVFH